MKFGMRQRFGLERSQLFQIVALLALLVAVNQTAAHVPTEGANSSTELDRQLGQAGLKVQWFAHASRGVKSKLVDWAYVIDENTAKTYFQISGGDYSEIFSTLDIGPSGKPFGLEGGQEYAEVRQIIVAAELKAKYKKDIEVKVSQFSVPQSRLFTLTSEGHVRALDAETGELIWETSLPETTLGAVGIGANEEHVVVAIGAQVHLLDQSNGKEVWMHKCRSIVSSSPSVVADEVYVPLFDNRVQKFYISKKGFNSSAFVSKGETLTKPLTTGLSISWGSQGGGFNVGGRAQRRASLGFTLRTGAPVVASAAYRMKTFFVGSTNGFLYSVDELTGRTNWEVSTGGGIGQSPFLIGPHVFIVNDLEELHKFDADSGLTAEGWDLPKKGVKTFLGASDSKLYFLDVAGRLKVLSSKTGTVLGSSTIAPVSSFIAHMKSDRLFLADNQGAIRCIREIGRTQPYFHSGEFTPPKQKAKPTEDNSSEGKNPFGDSNPFEDKAKSNPFEDAGDAKPEPDTSNPFEGG